MKPNPKLSLCVCTYFEEDCIEAFVAAVRAAIDGQIDYEIVFTDDGSTDKTVSLIEHMAAADERIKLVVLTRNHGKNSAVTSCISHASGEYLLMMDPDLQDPPAMILDFVNKIEEGYDIVYGIREKKSDTMLNTLFSKAFWSSLNWFTGLNIPKNLSVMRCFNRAFREHFLTYGERIRFIEGIFFDIGMRQATLSVPNLERFAGQSKFTFMRKINLAFNAIIAFSDRPIKLMTVFGTFLFSLSGLYTLKAVIRRLFYDEIQNGVDYCSCHRHRLRSNDHARIDWCLPRKDLY